MITAEWIKCVNDDDEPIRVNIALATVIEPRKKGCRVHFIGDGHIGRGSDLLSRRLGHMIRKGFLICDLTEESRSERTLRGRRSAIINRQR